MTSRNRNSSRAGSSRLLRRPYELSRKQMRRALLRAQEESRAMRDRELERERANFEIFQNNVRNEFLERQGKN